MKRHRSTGKTWLLGRRGEYGQAREVSKLQDSMEVGQGDLPEALPLPVLQGEIDANELALEMAS